MQAIALAGNSLPAALSERKLVLSWGMTYLLDSDSSLSRQLGRLVRDELSGAAEVLHPSADDEAIHEARKSIKRVRAILRLLQPSLGRHYDKLVTGLRAAAHTLAGLRDTEASLETFDFLAGEYRLITAKARRAASLGLHTHQRVARENADRQLRTAREILESMTDQAGRRVEAIAEWRTIRKGGVRGYQRVCGAGEDLEPTSSTTDFHRWRRRLKEHWYQTRLLRDLMDVPRDRLTRLESLEESLGMDHNLAILADRLLAHPERFGQARDVTVVLGCIARKRRVLRADTLELRERLFAESVKEFAGRLPKRLKEARRTKGAGS